MATTSSIEATPACKPCLVSSFERGMNEFEKPSERAGSSGKPPKVRDRVCILRAPGRRCSRAMDSSRHARDRRRFAALAMSGVKESAAATAEKRRVGLSISGAVRSGRPVFSISDTGRLSAQNYTQSRHEEIGRDPPIASARRGRSSATSLGQRAKMVARQRMDPCHASPTTTQRSRARR
jgi:hypothetical protein